MKVQSCELTVVLLSNGACLKYVVVKLLLGICRIDDGEGHEEHALVTALQLLQELFRFVAIGGKV